MRPIVIVENFNPDQEAMQDALDYLMRVEVKKSDSTGKSAAPAPEKEKSIG